MVEETPPPPMPQTQPRRWQWLATWQFWIILAILLASGMGAFALAVLLRLPGLPNCPAVFWPLAPASLRFECARIAASKRSPDDLLEAIALVDSLPANHPLREEADRLVELWSQEVLNLAEELFHEGKLSQAIAAARRIPAKASSRKVVEERIQRWQSIWSRAEDLYRKAENALRKLDWREAFGSAVRLLDVDNTYWQTTRYDELNHKINTAREDGKKLGRAERLADAGGLDDLLEAIKLVKSIRKDSYVYNAAQELIPKFGRKMMDLAEDLLDRRDLQGALNVVSKIPPEAKLDEITKDFTILATARSHVWQNTIPGLEDAISQAQRIGANRPLYRKAQQLIGRWQLEIEAIAQLEHARMLAQPGTVTDLAAAIAQASTIPPSNPRWDEVQQQIRRWRNEIETIEDRPILEEAEFTASQGDVASLQAAIDQARRVAPGRALSGEAESKIRTWTGQIQRIQDQPYLDQARDYASAGNLQAAIAAAEQIRSGRSLYNEAQGEIRKWRNTIQAELDRAQAQRDLQEANRRANSGLPDDLVDAIRLADRVPASTGLRTEADTLITAWSRQLLETARSQAGYDLLAAIATAQKIPANTPVHTEAQTQIATWKKALGR
jgi:soluble cytochrome b562